MNFFLQVHSHAAIGADDFVRAYPRVRRHIAAGIGDTDVRGLVTNNVVGALDCRGNQMLQKLAAAPFGIRIGLGGAELGNHR